ncbi:MAG: helix-hairpin-helix domain-containing protein [Myxococcota bacterium]
MNDITRGVFIIIALLCAGCVDPMPVYATYVPDNGPSVDLRPKRVDEELVKPPTTKPPTLDARDDAPREAEERDAPRAPTPAALPCGPVLDLNDASEQELQQLKGVGPATAARIVEARGRRPFRHPNHLRRVKGIGPKTMKRLRACVRVGGS